MIKLPKNVEIDINALDFSWCENDEDKDYVVSEYLAEEYGFCVWSFNWEVVDNIVIVSDITWDTED